MLTPRLTRHLALATIAAGATAAIAGAAVVISPISNIQIPLDVDGIYIHVESGNTYDNCSGLPGWDINPYGQTSLSWYASTLGGYARNLGDTNKVDNLGIGALVDSSRAYGSGQSEFGPTTSSFVLSSDYNYVGFRFTASDGLTHYGFLQLCLGNSLTDPLRSIIGIAYESEAGVGITTFQIGQCVPTPGVLAAFAMLPVLGRRRR